MYSGLRFIAANCGLCTGTGASALDRVHASSDSSASRAARSILLKRLPPGKDPEQSDMGESRNRPRRRNVVTLAGSSASRQRSPAFCGGSSDGASNVSIGKLQKTNQLARWSSAGSAGAGDRKSSSLCWPRSGLAELQEPWGIRRNKYSTKVPRLVSKTKQSSWV